MALRSAGRHARELDRIVAEHAIRGAAIHVLLRVVLVGFAFATVLWAPPQFYLSGCWILVICYAAGAVGIGFWFLRDPEHLVRLTSLILTGDLLLFGALDLLAGVSDRPSWTAYILVNGFVLIPIMAAAQLRMSLSIAIGAGAVAFYLISSASAQDANAEPWSSVVLRTFVVAAVALGGVLLTQVQRSRVSDIALLAHQRADLLAQLSLLEEQERRDLAEALHDGALQYLLGARFDLDDARDGDPAAVDRIDEALTTSAQLLRSTVSELHPAVLKQAGLAQALRDLTTATGTRGRLDASFEELEGAGVGARNGSTSSSLSVGAIGEKAEGQHREHDLILYSAVRELLANVVKHAAARSVDVRLVRDGRSSTVTVTDDGRGIADGALAQRLAEGHIGLASHRLRVEAAGGELSLAAGRAGGTVATVTVPD